MKLPSSVSVPRLVGIRPALSAADFPYDGIASEKLQFFVHYATLAPSGHNTQPWKFAIRGPELELRADRSRAMPVADPQNRELVMSCGAALLHLRVAVRNFGYTCSTEVCPDPDDPDLLARLRLIGRAPAGRTDHKLFKAMGERRTARVPFESRSIPRALLFRWQRAAMYEEAWLHIVDSPEARREIAELIDESGRDGLPGYSMGLGALSSRVAPAGIFPWGNLQAKRDLALAAQAPAFLVLGTDEDNIAAWMTAGQALARVLLAAQSEGVSASFFLQPVELLQLRQRLMELLPGETGYPQITFRLGYSPRVPPTPRRALSDVVTLVEAGDIEEGESAFEELLETENEYSD
jgi:hypothetical protein